MNNKNYFYKYLLCLILLFNSTLSLLAEDSVAEETRTEHLGGTLPVAKNGTVDIDNTYGSITVTHWDKKNEVDIRVVITAKAKNAQQAEAALQRATVEFGNKLTKTYAKTLISSKHTNTKNESLQIDFFIKASPEVALKLKQSYGNIYLPEHNHGNYELNVQYGNIRAGNFTKRVAINAQYSNISLENVNDLNMKITYCGKVDLGCTEKASIDSKYSNLKIEYAKQIKINKTYGNIEITEADDFTGEIKYSDLIIGKLNNILKVDDLSYSNLQAKEVNSSFKSIYVSPTYGNVTLHIPEKTAFEITAKNMRYADCKIKGFKLEHLKVEAPTYYHYSINGGGSGRITFDGNNYSNLTIRKY